MLKNNRIKIRGNGLRVSLFMLLIFVATGYTFAGDTNNKVKPKANKTLVKNNKSSIGHSQRIIVRFKQGMLSSASDNLHRSLGSQVKKSFKAVPGLQVVEVGPGKDVNTVLNKYRKDPFIIYAEPDYRIYLTAVPDDTQFADLWGLNNTGQTGGTVDADINAPEAWDLTTGDENVVVAVLDTGVDYTHVDLADNMWINSAEALGVTGVDDDGNGYIDDIYGIDPSDSDSDPMDIEGHGTHVAGTIGARGNNTTGVTGVNWNVSIIACKIFSSSNGQDIPAFVSDAVECLDYLRRLKINQGVNIVATNNSWGWIGNPSQTLMDAIERQLDAGILFVAAAGNESLNTDQFLENPSGYYIPNVISVAASTHTDNMATFSNTGKRTVHVAAPGEDVLSTVPGITNLPVSNPHSNIFLDDVESGRGSWNPQSPWAITVSDAYSASSSWADSPVGNYSNNVNLYLMSPQINLSAYAGQPVYLGFYINHQIEDFFDQLIVEISNGFTWTSIESITGDSGGWKFVSLAIPPTHRNSNFRFRFRLNTDSSITEDGVFIDDIGIGTAPPPGSDSYDLASGTSMASPHVVGLAALIKAGNAALSWSEIKNLIISSGTPGPDFANTTIGGRRVRASDPGNTGALDCTDQTVLTRLQPTQDDYGIEEGQLVNISMLHINCDAPAGSVSVTIAETGDMVTLLDDGTGFDRVAGDGIYSAQIDMDTLGRENISLQFPDSSSVDVRIVNNYYPAVRNEYSWRDISAVQQALMAGNVPGEDYDDQTSYFDVPFDIPFGDSPVPYNRLAVDTNGYVILQRTGDASLEFSIFENFEIPLIGLPNMVAVFWDDLVVNNDPASNVYWGVLGTAPDRELVITWQNVRAFGGSVGMTFQVVFQENSSDIIVNYQDTVTPDAFVNSGVGATSGVQVSPTIGTQYSYNQAVLRNLTSLRWSMTPVPSRKAPGGGGGSFALMLLLLVPIVFARSICNTKKRRGTAA